jgi:hypothetical protein
MMNKFILETLRIRPKNLAAFTEHYQHILLPDLRTKMPDKMSICRFEEYGAANSLAWFTQRHLTVYQADETTLTDVLPKHWPNISVGHPEGIYYCERVLFEEIYAHPRNNDRPAFERRPFFVVAVDVNPAKHNVFVQWYHHEYLPKTLADIPVWSACRRYRAKNISDNVIKEITIYEADNEGDLNRGFELLRAPYRYGSNEDWERYVKECIVSQDAMSFRPIFYLP